MDEIARLNCETFTREHQQGKEWTVPWLDLNVSDYQAFATSQSGSLPSPLGDHPADRRMYAGVAGLEILLLAGGGGQQSAAFSLLGAHVTVLDLTPQQLAGDELAARRYGYSVATVLGDMRDLSRFPSAGFDRVYQPISSLYVPDLPVVYAGVAHLLKPGGLYFSTYTFPLLYLADVGPWDGQGYPLSVRSPYRRGAVLESPGGALSLTTGAFIGEFHHRLSDICNGLIDAGFILQGLWESPAPSDDLSLAGLEPGSAAHRDQYLPFGLNVIAGISVRQTADRRLKTGN